MQQKNHFWPAFSEHSHENQRKDTKFAKNETILITTNKYTLKNHCNFHGTNFCVCVCVNVYLERVVK